MYKSVAEAGALGNHEQYRLAHLYEIALKEFTQRAVDVGGSGVAAVSKVQIPLFLRDVDTFSKHTFV